MMFLPILLSSASYVTRMMITEFAEEGVSSLLENLSNRRQFLGISGKSVENFVTTKLSGPEEASNVRDKTTLDFMMSFFPTDIDFKYLTKVDAYRNNWDDIIDMPEISEADDVPLDFISFSGNNAVFENALGNFANLLNSKEEQPFLKENLLPVKNKLWEIRNVLIKRKCKILAHCYNNDVFLTLYSPEDIKDFRDDLEVYLTDKNYPFGTCFAIIKISSSINNRKVGLVENGFINGNLNSTYDMIEGKLKVSPPMKAMIDDSYRKKILKDEKYNSELREQFGFVIDPEGNERLPNVTDYMFIPAAMASTITVLNDVILVKTKADGTKLISQVNDYINRIAVNRFEGSFNSATMREEMTNFMLSDEPNTYVRDALEQRDVMFTLNGVNNFLASWTETYKGLNNSGSAYVNLLNNLVVDFGFSGYGIRNSKVRYWIDAYVRRMDNVPFMMKESRPTKLSEFFRGLQRVVKDLDMSNILTLTDVNTVEVIDDYIEAYDKKASYDIRTKKKIKNKKFELIKQILSVAVRSVGHASVKQNAEVTQGEKDELESHNIKVDEAVTQDDILNDVVNAK